MATEPTAPVSARETVPPPAVAAPTVSPGTARAATPDARAADAFVRRWIRPAWYPALAYAVSRVLGALAIASVGAIQGKSPFDHLVAVWDGGWYTAIAEQGYPHRLPLGPHGRAAQSVFGFFPGYPLMVRAATSVTGMSTQDAGFVLTTAGGLVATLGVWAIARKLCGDEVGRRSALLFVFFPGAFVFSFMYAEGVMLAFAVLALLAVMERRWFAAGLLAAVATAIRPNACVLVVCFAWAAVAAIRERHEWRALVAPILAPLGAVSFFAYEGHRLGGTYGFWFRVQDEGWNQRFDFGVNTVKKVLWLVDDYSGVTAQAVLTAGFVAMVALLVLLWRWKPPAVLTIWTVGILFLALTSEQQGARPRYLLTAFPLVIAAARELDGEVFRWVLTVSACLMMLMTVLVAHPLTLEP
ncbi:MAG TPA: glycosyltransferase family 39 protein [Acidimicrobiia bacterium]|nr:glycosyltransferase family 39 protein [Acidimicrobiia bacterium]